MRRWGHTFQAISRLNYRDWPWTTVEHDSSMANWGCRGPREEHRESCLTNIGSQYNHDSDIFHGESIGTRLFITTSWPSSVLQTLTQTLINVALHPEWATRLRSEATSALMERGWTRQMLNNLPEADAFIKESMRKNTLGSSKFILHARSKG